MELYISPFILSQGTKRLLQLEGRNRKEPIEHPAGQCRWIDGKPKSIDKIKKSILSEVEEVKKNVKDLRVDLRFGHASFPEDGDDYEKLIFKANILK